MAKPNLNAVLAELDDEHIAQAVHMRHAVQFSKYTIQTHFPAGEKEFTREIGRYYIHQKGATTPTGQYVTFEWLAERYVTDIVNAAYAKLGGSNAACDMAMKGINGGMKPIIDVIYSAIVRDHENKYIEMVLCKHISKKDWREHVEVMDQFLNQFGSHLPGRNPMKLASDYEEMIKLLAENLNQIRLKVRK